MTSSWPRAYAHFPNIERTSGNFRLRPLRWEDREPIRRWRNEQIDVLRQTTPLSAEDQAAYYRTVLAPQFEEREPRQVLWALEEYGNLIGYGGLVHIAWSDARAEVSFLTDTRRVSELLPSDWAAYLHLLIPIARDSLQLRKLTTETFATRSEMFPVLEANGFVREGVLRDHHRESHGWTDSHVHALILS